MRRTAMLRVKPNQITRATFLLGVGGAAALAAFGARATAQSSRPNILWIVDDDHPPYMMDPMPFTRKLVRDRGAHFAAGATDVPLCGPARVSLLTGLSVTTHGCWTNDTYDDYGASPLGLPERAVHRLLREAGYDVGHFGKWINGLRATQHPEPGWDVWRGIGGDASTQGERRGNVDGEWRDIPVRASSWAGGQCADFVRERSASGRPWFAHLTPSTPHNPYDPSADSRHLYDGDARNVPSTNEGDMGDKVGWMRGMPKVDRDTIRHMTEGKKEELADKDRHIVRPVIEALAEPGQLANTLVFFTSDNGYHAGGEHRMMRKDTPYWESAEVPFFVRGPGVVPGTVSDALVCHVDIPATTVAAAGLDPEALGMDGRDLAPVLRGEPGPRKRLLVTGSRHVGPETGGDGPGARWWLLMEGPKRYVLRDNGFEELYRTDSDPFQKRSRADSADPALMRRLRGTVEAMRSASGAERRSLESAPASELSAML